MTSKNSMLRSFLAIFTVLLVSACADPGQESGEATDARLEDLERRVEERWQARIAHDWGKAWEYTSPAYREVFPKHLYVKKFSYAAEWELTGAELLHYDGDAAVASVVVRVMSKPTKQTSTASVLVGAIPRELREKWIFDQGEWWYSANY